MIRLERNSKFPSVFSKLGKDGIYSYQDAEKGLFRCPYITGTLDGIIRVIREVPLIWYFLPKDQDININVCQIRKSILYVEEINLDKLYNEKKMYKKKVTKIFGVNPYGIGFQIPEKIEEAISKGSEIYVNNKGTIFIITKEVMYITPNLCDFIEIPVSKIRKEYFYDVEYEFCPEFLFDEIEDEMAGVKIALKSKLDTKLKIFLIKADINFKSIDNKVDIIKTDIL